MVLVAVLLPLATHCIHLCFMSSKQYIYADQTANKLVLHIKDMVRTYNEIEVLLDIEFPKLASFRLNVSYIFNFEKTCGGLKKINK